MRLSLTTILALVPLAATAGGHGAFYVCEADGLEPFEIEVAAGDCTVDGQKAEKMSEDPDVCDFGDAGPGKVTLASDLGLTVESGGQTYAGMCRTR